MNGVVYFIRAGREGPIKIGWASSPEHAGKRLSALQTGSAIRLVLVGLREGSQVDEGALHARFAEQQIGGEWFWPSSELLTEIGVNLDWPPGWEEVLTRRAGDEGRARADILLEAFIRWLGHPAEDVPLLLDQSDEALERWADRWEARQAERRKAGRAELARSGE